MYAREQFGDMNRIAEESTSNETINRLTVVGLDEKNFLNPNYCLINAVPGPNQKAKKVPIRATISGQSLSYEGKVELSPVSNFSLMRRDVFLYCTEGDPNGELKEEGQTDLCLKNTFYQLIGPKEIFLTIDGVEVATYFYIVASNCFPEPFVIGRNDLRKVVIKQQRRVIPPSDLTMIQLS